MIFAINIPICVIAYLLASKYIPESRDKLASRTCNWVESFAISLLMTLLITILAEGGYLGWLSIETIMLASVFIILLVALYFYQSRTDGSGIDMKLFVNENFRYATLIGAISYFSMYAWLFLFNLYLQKVLGYTAIYTGFICSFFSLAFIIGSKFLSLFINKLSNKKILKTGFIMSMIAFILMSINKLDTMTWILAGTFFLLGISINLINTVSMLTATKSVNKDKAGVASSVIFSIRWLGGSIGVAVISSVYQYASIDGGPMTSCILLFLISLIGFMCISQINFEQ